jgi:glycosyltransferase involved in cell wall biosynthesis
MRDTEGGRKKNPKLVKGPDIFADIVTNLYYNDQPIHVVLAGPRRHWLRKVLQKRKVPFTYFGWRLPFEDMRINTLDRRKLNILYNHLDLSLVTSRSEAGPHAILEAAAAGCAQISTPVGIAPDVLPETQIYKTVDDAVKIISEDIKRSHLSYFTKEIRKRVDEMYTPEAVKKLYQIMYNSVLKNEN